MNTEERLMTYKINDLALMRMQTYKAWFILSRGPKSKTHGRGKPLFYQDTPCMMVSHRADCKDTGENTHTLKLSTSKTKLDNGSASFGTY